jgi:hypothetical protein
MWVCLNNAFFSIVAPAAKDADPETHLMVRARRPGDIERVFPDAKVVELDGRDYQFRAYIDRVEVGTALMHEVMAIDYGNFKNSVKDDRLHHAYNSFWHSHAKLQPRPPYSRIRKPQHRTMPQFGGLLAGRGLF